MRKIYWMTALLAVIAITSCKRNLFDAEQTKKALELTFHNDVVDPQHTWTLMNDQVITVTANVANVVRIELLSANPYAPNDNDVELLAQREASEGDQVTMNYDIPVANDSVYVAAVTESGTYTVVAVKQGRGTVDFSTLNTTNTGQLTSPSTQNVFYCYCNSYPMPSTTWGFNDLVMKLSKEVVDNSTLRVNVTLVALGSTNQMAGALRLHGVSQDEIESVTIHRGTFAKYTSSQRLLIKDEELLLKGQDGSAVINLFDDAHMAFFVRTSDNGSVNRYMINVSHTSDLQHMEFSPVTVSYDIKFKQPYMPYSIGFSKLDPFILYYYNSNIWEIHKYAYKFKETLYSYYSDSPKSYDNGFSWVIEIPYSWFRYPLIGNSMGSYKNGAIYGSYQQPHHSFGEWGSDHTTATDWYLYPTANSVY